MTGCNCGEIQCVCTQIFNAYATSTSSAYTRDGQLVTSSASATASSSLSYEDAYQIALQTAQSIANQNAVHDANVINEANPIIYYASKRASGSATTNSGQVITASASATATSTLSQNDADTIASNNAQSIANQTAQNDVNIINQSFPRLVSLTNLSGSGNSYDVSDNTNNYYIKGSTGNSTSMTPTFFSLGNFTINASAIDSNGNIYVGGNSISSISNPNGVSSSNGLLNTYNYIAKWDGTTWSAVGSGLSGTVNAIAIDASNNVYAGGSFTSLGDGTTANRVAKWDGTTWSALGNGVGGITVNAISIDSSNNVYVGGNFITLGDGTTANRVAKWDGNTWSALIGGGINGVGNSSDNAVNAIAIDSSNNVYVSGIFTRLGDGTTVANRVAKWSGSAWSAVTGSGINGVGGTVNAIGIDASDNIYVGGIFTRLGDNTTVANRVAKWNGSAWSALTDASGVNGVNNTVSAIAIGSSNTVYLGGAFTTLGNGTAANRIVKWIPSTSSWSTVGGENSTSSNGLPSTSECKSIIYLSDTNIYASSNSNTIGTSNLFQLITDYVNVYYNNIVIRQPYFNGQTFYVYTNNTNGQKMCNVVAPTTSYQNYF